MRNNEASQNKYTRGVILRRLVNGTDYKAFAQQIMNPLVENAMIKEEDISKHFAYLHEAGYIEILGKKETPSTAYENDALIKLTRKGVDLVEGTIEDAGVDV